MTSMGPGAQFRQGGLQLAARIGTVGEHMAQPGLTDAIQQPWGAIAILHISRMDNGAVQQAHRFGENVPLAAFQPAVQKRCIAASIAVPSSNPGCRGNLDPSFLAASFSRAAGDSSQRRGAGARAVGGRQVILQVARWLPERQIVSVTDGRLRCHRMPIVFGPERDG